MKLYSSKLKVTLLIGHSQPYGSYFRCLEAGQIKCVIDLYLAMGHESDIYCFLEFDQYII